MNKEGIEKYRCIHLADRRDRDKLCRAIEELKQYKDREQNLIDKLEKDKMEQFDDYIIYLIESYLEIVKGEKNENK